MVKKTTDTTNQASRSSNQALALSLTKILQQSLEQASAQTQRLQQQLEQKNSSGGTTPQLNETIPSPACGRG